MAIHCQHKRMDGRREVLASNTATSIGDDQREHLLLPSRPVVRVIGRIRGLRHEDDFPRRVVLEEATIYTCDFEVYAMEFAQGRCPGDMFELVVIEDSQRHGDCGVCATE
jgi:hypothetical protein